MPRLLQGPTGSPRGQSHLLFQYNPEFGQNGWSLTERIYDEEHLDGREFYSVVTGNLANSENALRVDVMAGLMTSHGPKSLSIRVTDDSGDEEKIVDGWTCVVKSMTGDSIEPVQNADDSDFWRFDKSKFAEMTTPWLQINFSYKGEDYILVMDEPKDAKTFNFHHPSLGLDFAGVYFYGGKLAGSTFDVFDANGLRLPRGGEPSTECGTAFPETKVGEVSEPHTFKIRNIGSLENELQDITFETDNGEFYVKDKPATTQPFGQTSDMTLCFRPKDTEKRREAIQLVNSSENNRWAVIKVSGVGEK